jgi:HAD superfamily hydrolase (TIGR01490 family)
LSLSDSRGAAVHLFDVDYTLIRKSSTYYFLRDALREKFIRLGDLGSLPIEWLRYKFGIIHGDFIETATRKLAGFRKEDLERTARICFERSLRANIYREAFELIQELRRQGKRALFVSSAYHSLLEPLEEYFGVEGSLASALEFAGGKTTGRALGAVLFGPNKKQAALEWLAGQGIPPEEVWFYSDSYTDLPLLESCGHPVAVNPDRFLAREARRRGWEIRRWKETLG